MPRRKMKDPTAKKIPKRGIARQKALPGMDDAKISVLEHAATNYAEVRDERMAWTKKEVEAKQRVQKLMHAQKRTHYQRANIEITLEPEGEKVVVRVREPQPEQTPAVKEPVEPPQPDNEPPAEPEEPEDDEEDLDQPADAAGRLADEVEES